MQGSPATRRVKDNVTDLSDGRGPWEKEGRYIRAKGSTWPRKVVYG